MTNQAINENMMHTESAEMPESSGKVRQAFSRIKSGMPAMMSKGKSPAVLISALLVTGLAVLGYVLYSKRKSEQDMTDFASSLDETSIEHGRVGAA